MSNRKPARDVEGPAPLAKAEKSERTAVQSPSQSEGTLKGATEGITVRNFLEAQGVEDWRVLGEGACTYFRTGSFAVGVRLLRAIGELTGLEDHHPDVDVRYDGVTVRLVTITPDYFGLSKRDVVLARQISALARSLGVPADPSAVQTV